MGNEARASEYWRSEKEKVYRACQSAPETMVHVLRECDIIGRHDMDWRRLLSGDRISISRLNEVLWKRRRVMERQEAHGRNEECP